MRLITLSLVALCCSACVSSGKYNDLVARSTGQLAALERTMLLQQDSMQYLAASVERLRGGNESLLVIHERVQDRLAQKENELDALRGNLTSTSSQLSNRIAKLQEEAAAAAAAYDTLLLQQEEIISGFQKGVRKALAIVTDSLDGKFSDADFRVSEGAGMFTLSVQEDLLFRPRSVDRLTDQAPIILRSIMDALQSDPLLKLTVIGHTDNEPNARRGTDNWEYAALRATHIANELAKEYYLSPNRVIAASHGENGPQTSNATEAGRRANRRIDFVLRNNTANLLRELTRLQR